jgi:hypothetical protein
VLRQFLVEPGVGGIDELGDGAVAADQVLERVVQFRLPKASSLQTRATEEGRGA